METDTTILPPHLQKMIDAGVSGTDVLHGELKNLMLIAEHKYTETYVRPSLSDIMAFDIIKDMINESIDDPENSDYLFKSDIYRIWADVIESDTVWSLEYGTDTMFESVAEWLQESGNMVYKEDIEEEEDEDESDE